MTDRAGYAGMTVNERLFVAGRLDAFDAAIAAKDRAAAVALLVSLDMTEEQAAETAIAVLATTS